MKMLSRIVGIILFFGTPANFWFAGQYYGQGKSWWISFTAGCIGMIALFSGAIFLFVLKKVKNDEPYR